MAKLKLEKGILVRYPMTGELATDFGNIVVPHSSPLWKDEKFLVLIDEMVERETNETNNTETKE